MIAALLVAGPSCDTDSFVVGQDQGQKPRTDGPGWLDGYQWPDIGAGGPCKAGQDLDKDGIPDDVEGCGANQKDTDADQFPDYNDADADGDKVPDKIEAGSNPKTPKDSDGDKTPDYKETDSDGDGVKDGDEDLNADGLLGCCLTTCGEKRTGCPDPGAGNCGLGQQCASGTCQPLVHFLCGNGESDPGKKATFPDTKVNDNDLPTFVCHKSGELTGQGLKPMQFKKSTQGGWHLALEQKALYGDLTISGAKTNEAAAAMELSKDDAGNAANVAGFIVSLPATGSDVTQIAANLVAKISSQLPGKATVSQVVSGSQITSHDGFPTVISTQLAITLSAGKNAPGVRNDLFTVLLSRSASQLSNLPAANFGPVATEHVLIFQTLLRQAEGRLLIMGAVAAKSDVGDLNKKTGMYQDDLSNGTGVATLVDGDTVECDPFYLKGNPIADIIWVVDESGSMDDNRQDIINNANDFFARAIQSGLDFRMGVAGMKDPTSGGTIKLGKFCSVSSTNTSDDGGTDRFLKSGEQSAFTGCIKNPPYYEGYSEYGLAHTDHAVTLHLPRAPSAAGDQTKIRKEATLVIIIVTDEAPQEMKSYTTYNGQAGFLGYSDYSISNCTSSKQTEINNYVKNWITLLTGKHAQHGADAKAIVHLIGGVCQSSCGYGPEYPWGYQEIVKATGGQMADICQKNLGTTLQKIIDSVAGSSSTAKLQYVPMSASLAVALGKQKLARSRVKGFDYSRASNSLVFMGVTFKAGDAVVASYRRWTKQTQLR